MKRMLVALTIGALLTIAGPARADSQPCNLKAVRHTAVHLAKATDPVRIALLQARYDRLVSRCSMPPHH